jgi:hypothetical protein
LNIRHREGVLGLLKGGELNAAGMQQGEKRFSWTGVRIMFCNTLRKVFY